MKKNLYQTSGDMKDVCIYASQSLHELRAASWSLDTVCSRNSFCVLDAGNIGLFDLARKLQHNTHGANLLLYNHNANYFPSRFNGALLNCIQVSLEDISRPHAAALSCWKSFWMIQDLFHGVLLICCELFWYYIFTADKMLIFHPWLSADTMSFRYLHASWDWSIFRFLNRIPIFQSRQYFKNIIPHYYPIVFCRFD